MEMLLPTILIIIVITFVLLYIVGKAQMQKEQKAKDAEAKAVQDAATEKALELKKRADAYVYTDVQMQRLEALDKFGERDTVYPQSRDRDEFDALEEEKLDELDNSEDFEFSELPSDRSRYNRMLPSGLLMILDYCDKKDSWGNLYREGDRGEYIGIFEDEVLPSPAMKEKYHMIPMSREEFAKTYSVDTDGFAAREYDTSTVYVENKSKSVVGGAVKGAIVAGGVGAVVGAIATADKNNHRGGHYVTVQEGYGHYVGELSVAVKGVYYDNDSGKGIEFAYKPNKFWVHDALLEKFLLNKVIDPNFVKQHAREKHLAYPWSGEYRNSMQEFYQFDIRSRERGSDRHFAFDFVKFINKVIADNAAKAKVRTASTAVYKGCEGRILIDIRSLLHFSKIPTEISTPTEIEINFIYDHELDRERMCGDKSYKTIVVSANPMEELEKLLASGDLVITQY